MRTLGLVRITILAACFVPVLLLSLGAWLFSASGVVLGGFAWAMSNDASLLHEAVDLAVGDGAPLRAWGRAVRLGVGEVAA